VLIFVILLRYWARVRGHAPEGRVFWLYLVLYGGFRFATSFLRLDPILFAGLQEAQLLGLGYVVVGVPALIWSHRPAAPARLSTTVV
jgi:prolipoprotein diacylglyceryltransferase